MGCPFGEECCGLSAKTFYKWWWIHTGGEIWITEDGHLIDKNSDTYIHLFECKFICKNRQAAKEADKGRLMMLIGYASTYWAKNAQDSTETEFYEKLSKALA